MKKIFFNKRSNTALTLSDLPRLDILERELVDMKYRERYLNTLKSTIFTLISTAAVAILVATLWLPVLQIYGNSMTPTLNEGDFVVSFNTRNLHQGDLVAFYYNNKLLVKRLIATSGQWVNINQDGTVVVDGVKLNETYLKELSYGETNIELPYQVPEGKYFVMGDHRSTSIDSRNTAIGSIGEEQIVGKLLFRIWPFDQISSFSN